MLKELGAYVSGGCDHVTNRPSVALQVVICFSISGVGLNTD